MTLLARITTALRHVPQPVSNDHANLLVYIEAERFLPAILLWHRLGRPNRRNLLRLAGYREKVTAFDRTVLLFGLHLRDVNYIQAEQGGLPWQPHWLMHARMPEPLVLLH